MKIILVLLICEIVLIYVFGYLTLNDSACNTSNNWYWSTNTNPGLLFDCPNSAVNTGPASKTSKIEFDTLHALVVIMPITVLGVLVVFYQNREKK